MSTIPACALPDAAASAAAPRATRSVRRLTAPLFLLLVIASASNLLSSADALQRFAAFAGSH